MVRDPEEHETKRQLVLQALLSAVDETQAKDSNADATCIGLYESDLAKQTEFERRYVDRICQELSEEGLLKFMGGMGGLIGRSCCLTNKGLKAAEKHRYEKTFLAKKRKVIAAAKEGGILISKRALASLWAAIVGLGFFATFKEQIIRGLKHLIGQ